ncbi:MAG: YdcF family protein [Kangiellaceae bacterium]|nr:YdcF family protein [Kangiellaceae bacterium]
MPGFPVRMSMQPVLRVAKGLFSISVVSFYLVCIPAFSNYLLAKLEATPALNTQQIKAIQTDGLAGNRAIVVLAGGRITKAPEYGEIDAVNSASLERIRYAAWLQKRLQLPVLLSGGSVNNEATSEAVLMNQVMMSGFGTAPKWIESNSRNTAENATFSAAILAKAKISEIILVTHAWHMPRAQKEFEKQQLKVVPAPMGYLTAQSEAHSISILPSTKAFYRSTIALHELLGLVWYELRY